MRQILLLSGLALFVGFSSQAQTEDCAGAEAFEVVHGNNIRTMVSAGGDLFWDLQEGRFNVPFESPNSPTTIFASSIWLGGYDENGTLKVAAQRFRSSTIFDYTPGPLVVDGTTDKPVCEQWDRVWTTTRIDIERHLDDFREDDVVDNPLSSIYSWPGKGNIYFEQFNGFPLPDIEHLSAPFYDANHNDIYEPQLGEYPLPENVNETVVPNQLSWCVFNDAGADHTSSFGEIVQAEFQLTSYAFFCTGGSVLDNSVFTSFKVVNRSDVRLDSLHFGLWMDPDVGCFLDDYMGSYPQGNAFFAYNQDPEDGENGSFCPSYNGPFPTYGMNPPVQSGCFLNRSMSSYMTTANEGVGSVPVWAASPQMPIEFYRYMTGRWRDGTPLSYGEDGYDPTGQADPTSFIFPDNPQDTAGWSLYNLDAPFADRRTIASTNLNSLDAGEAAVIDIAFTFHSDEDLNNVETTALMYDEVDALHMMYAAGFADFCDYEKNECNNDCVYPGDVNNNGIVDGLDYLILATTIDKTGPERNAPLSWQPHMADDWVDKSIYGVNDKHLDCNGDGLIDTADFDIIDFYFDYTQPDYQAPAFERHGDDIEIRFPDTISTMGSVFTNKLFIDFKPGALDKLHGLMFTFEYNPEYFRPAIGFVTQSPLKGDSNLKFTSGSEGKMNVLFTSVDGIDQYALAKQVAQGLIPRVSGANIPNGEVTTNLKITKAYAVKSNGEVYALLGANKEVVITESPIELRNDDATPFTLYPNPTDGRVFMETPVHNAEYRIVQSDGRVVASGFTNGNLLQFDLPNGVYAAQLTANGQTYAEKVVVLR